MKTISIIGATGLQGSSVVKAFADTHHIRAITRDPSSSRAQALLSISPNITLIQADTSSLPSLITAFASSSLIYGVTDYWAPFSSPTIQSQHSTSPSPSDSIRRFAYDQEILNGKNIIDAAAATLASNPDFERFIWSGEASPEAISNGKYKKIYHFESKAIIGEYLETRHPELAKRSSTLYVGFYVSNLRNMKPFWPVKMRDGSFVVQRICDGDAKLPFVVTVEHTGVLTRALVEKGKPGDKLLGYTAMVSWAEMAGLWGEATGREVRFERLTLEEFERWYPVEGAELLSAPFAVEFGFAGRSGFLEPRDLGVELGKEEILEWLKKQDWTEVLNQPARDKE